MFTKIRESVQKFISIKERFSAKSALALLLPAVFVVLFFIVLPLVKCCGSAKNINSLDSNIELKLEKSFLSAQLSMAYGDSIGLIVNLRDSMLQMCLKGVVIHECSLHTFNISGKSRIFSDSASVRHFFSGKPLVLEREIATIAKLPIKIKKAPKDTLEAQSRTADAPGPLAKSYSRVMYEFSEGINIELVQIEPAKFSEILNKIIYGIRSGAGISLLSENQKEVNIKIFLDQSDVIAIYRATPGSLRAALLP